MLTFMLALALQLTTLDPATLRPVPAAELRGLLVNKAVEEKGLKREDGESFVFRRGARYMTFWRGGLDRFGGEYRVEDGIVCRTPDLSPEQHLCYMLAYGPGNRLYGAENHVALRQGRVWEVELLDFGGSR